MRTNSSSISSCSSSFGSSALIYSIISPLRLSGLDMAQVTAVAEDEDEEDDGEVKQQSRDKKLTSPHAA